MVAGAVVPTVVDKVFVDYMDCFRKPSDSSLGLLEACSSNVVLFSERMLGVKLYSWQVDFLSRLAVVCNEKDSSAVELLNKEFAVMTSRQIGKSTAVAIFSLWCCVFNKYPGRSSLGCNSVVGVVSASDHQAKKLLLEVKRLIALGDRHMSAVFGSKFPEKFFSRLIDGGGANNTSTVSFRAREDSDGSFLLKGALMGPVIKSYPPTAVVLGETFSVLVIDEAGMTTRISDLFFNEYAYPTGNARDALRIYLSTPWESSGFFYRVMDVDGTFGSTAERFIFTIDAISLEAPEYYSSVIKKVDNLRSSGYLDEANRAYYCRFVKSEKSYFDPEKVKAVFVDYPSVTGYSGECDLGVDFGGQVNSRTVVTISAFVDGKVRRLYHHSYPVGDDLSLIDDIDGLMKVFNVQRIIPDDCPAGHFLIKTMIEKGWSVHPMNFRSEKVKKFGSFRAAVNRGDVESYFDDELKVEMLSLQFEHGKSSSVIHAAPGEHDDLTDSFVLSAYFMVVDETDFRVYDVDDAADGADPWL